MNDLSEDSSIAPLVELIKMEIGRLLEGAGVEGAGESEVLADGLGNMLRDGLMRETLNEREQELIAGTQEFHPEFMDRLLTARVDSVLEDVQNTLAAALPDFKGDKLDISMVVARGDGATQDSNEPEQLLTQMVQDEFEQTMAVGDALQVPGKIILTNVGGAEALRTLAFDSNLGMTVAKPGDVADLDRTGPAAFEVGKPLQAIEQVVIKAAPEKKRQALESGARGEDLVGMVLGGKYRVGARLGRGGFGTVYKAQDIMLRANVAIKVLNRDVARKQKALENFLEEAQKITTLDHENIVRWITFDTTEDDLHYFVMEYLEGVELSDVLKETKQLEVGLASQILLQTLRALEVAHNETSGSGALLHLDLKPQNIFLGGPLSEEGVRVKVIDFGISQHVRQENFETMTFEPEESTLMPESGTHRRRSKRDSTHRPSQSRSRSGIHGATKIVRAQGGTPIYASPEQCKHLRGDRDIKSLDGRSDLYSLGVVAFKMLTGESPYPKATSALEAFRQHIEDEPKRIREVNPKVPRRIATFVDRCLEKDPDARWTDTTEARQALETAMQPVVSKQMLIALVVLAMLTGGLIYQGLTRETDTTDALHVLDPNGQKQVAINLDRGHQVALQMSGALGPDLKVYAEQDQSRVPLNIEARAEDDQLVLDVPAELEWQESMQNVPLIIQGAVLRAEVQADFHPVPTLSEGIEQVSLTYPTGRLSIEEAMQAWLRPDAGAGMNLNLDDDHGHWKTMSLHLSGPTTPALVIPGVRENRSDGQAFKFSLAQLGENQGRAERLELNAELHGTTFAGFTQPATITPLRVVTGAVPAIDSVQYFASSEREVNDSSHWQDETGKFRYAADKPAFLFLRTRLKDDFPADSGLSEQLGFEFSAIGTLQGQSEAEAESFAAEYFAPNIYVVDLQNLLTGGLSKDPRLRFQFALHAKKAVNWPVSRFSAQTIALTTKAINFEVLLNRHRLTDTRTWCAAGQVPVELSYPTGMDAPVFLVRNGNQTASVVRPVGQDSVSMELNLASGDHQLQVDCFELDEVQSIMEDHPDFRQWITTPQQSQGAENLTWGKRLAEHKALPLATQSYPLWARGTCAADIEVSPTEAGFWTKETLPDLRIRFAASENSAPINTGRSKFQIKSGASLVVELEVDPEGAYRIPADSIHAVIDGEWSIDCSQARGLCGNAVQLTSNANLPLRINNAGPKITIRAPHASFEGSEWTPENNRYTIEAVVNDPFAVSAQSVTALIQSVDNDGPSHRVELKSVSDQSDVYRLVTGLPQGFDRKTVTVKVEATDGLGVFNSAKTDLLKLGAVSPPLKHSVPRPKHGEGERDLILVRQFQQNYVFCQQGDPGPALDYSKSQGYSRGNITELHIEPSALQPFYIDRAEVSVGEFYAFFKAPENSAVFPDARKQTLNAYFAERIAANEMDLPVWGVHWTEAHAFAQSLGLRLPTALEWEIAMRTASTHPIESPRMYPNPEEREVYGRVGARSPLTASELAEKGFVTPNGIVGLAGNVSEWTSTGFWVRAPGQGQERYDWNLSHVTTPSYAPEKSKEQRYLVVGAHFAELDEGNPAPHDYRRKTFIANDRVGAKLNQRYHIGFRCARSINEETDSE